MDTGKRHFSMEFSAEDVDAMDISQHDSSMCVSSDNSASKRRKILAIKSPRDHRKKLYDDLKKKLKKILPTVFEKDLERGEFIFNLFCDIIRINNLIDMHNDMGSVEFIITEQRILRALNNFFSIKRDIVPSEYLAGNEKSLNSYMSPYKEQFDEKFLIGYGGYGHVFKAQHRLDEMYYAIKKISIETHKVKRIKKCLEEVKTLAKLNHPNVVLYKQAWIESATENDDNLELSQSRTNSFELNSNYLDNISNDVEFFRTIDRKCQSLALDSGESSNEPLKKQKAPRVILYIQMGLSGINLRQWMDNRAKNSSASDIEKIVTQILRGLNYIHELNVIHHDINPKNIFISDTLQVRIGDFGLACFPQKIIHSQELGTPCYIAPEQSSKQCNPKSDIYSFGVVLFELLVPMQTLMELSKELEKLKNGEIPENLLNFYPTLTCILKKSLREDPNLRASADELLEDLKRDNKERMAKLECENERLKEENNLLKMQIKNKDNLMGIFKNKLSKYEKQSKKFK